MEKSITLSATQINIQLSVPFRFCSWSVEGLWVFLWFWKNIMRFWARWNWHFNTTGEQILKHAF